MQNGTKIKRAAPVFAPPRTALTNHNRSGVAMAINKVGALEEWRAVKDYEGLYEVSSLGRVRSLDRIVIDTNGKRKRRFAGVVLKASLANTGYRAVTLNKRGAYRAYLVHTLVAVAFIGDAPGKVGVRKDSYQVNHKNLNKLDNRPCNLEWVTKRENLEHARKNGVIPTGNDLPHTVLTPDQVQEIRVLLSDYPDGLSFSDIGKMYGVSHGSISHIYHKRTWKHLP